MKGEKIAAIAPDLEAAPETKVIDATDHNVIPGVLDVHVHLELPFCGTVSSDDYRSGTRAGARGGVTTLIDFAYATADRSVQKGIEARDQQFAPKSCCDWAYHLMIGSDPPHTQMGELAEAIQAGYPTIKIFTTSIWPGRTGRMVDFGDIWEARDELISGTLMTLQLSAVSMVLSLFFAVLGACQVGKAPKHNEAAAITSSRTMFIVVGKRYTRRRKRA